MTAPDDRVICRVYDHLELNSKLSCTDWIIFTKKIFSFAACKDRRNAFGDPAVVIDCHNHVCHHPDEVNKQLDRYRFPSKRIKIIRQPTSVGKIAEMGRFPQCLPEEEDI